LYWLRYLTNFCRWKLMVRKPAGNSNFIYDVMPIVHSPRYTNNHGFGRQVKQRIFAEPE